LLEIIWTNRESLIKSKLADKPLFVAAPDTGLLSLIAGAHLIQTLKAELLGYIDADWIPPISIVNDGDPNMPIRIYSTNNLDILLSETPILPSAWRHFAIATYQVAIQLSSILVVGATGIPNPKRIDIQDINNLRVLYLGKFLDMEGISQNIREKYKLANKFTGTLAGPYSSLISLMIRHNMPFIMILVDSYPEYPDPESAAKLVEELNSMFNLNVEVKSLLDRGAEIRLMARQLAIQTKKHQLLAGQKTGAPPLNMYV